MVSIIDYLCSTLANPTPNIILITPGTVNSSLWPTRSPTKVAPYADSVRSIASDKGLPLVDLWSGPDALTADDLHDGLHLGPTGNAKLFRKLRWARFSSRANYEITTLTLRCSSF